jgi:hypothetical protein
VTPADADGPVGRGHTAADDPTRPPPAVPRPRVPAAPPDPPPERVKVVLAGRERVRTDPALEIEEQTQVGDVLVRGLIRTQLALALRLSALVAGMFGVLPLLFALAPGLTRTRVFGLELPWLLLGVVAYPVLLAVAWVYVRLADRNERDFVAMVDRS